MDGVVLFPSLVPAFVLLILTRGLQNFHLKDPFYHPVPLSVRTLVNTGAFLNWGTVRRCLPCPVPNPRSSDLGSSPARHTSPAPKDPVVPSSTRVVPVDVGLPFLTFLVHKMFSVTVAPALRSGFRGDEKAGPRDRCDRESPVGGTR